jgi:hypothetical protein
VVAEEVANMARLNGLSWDVVRLWVYLLQEEFCHPTSLDRAGWITWWRAAPSSMRAAVVVEGHCKRWANWSDLRTWWTAHYAALGEPIDGPFQWAHATAAALCIETGVREFFATAPLRSLHPHTLNLLVYAFVWRCSEGPPEESLCMLETIQAFLLVPVLRGLSNNHVASVPPVLVALPSQTRTLAQAAGVSVHSPTAHSIAAGVVPDVVRARLQGEHTLACLHRRMVRPSAPTEAVWGPERLSNVARHVVRSVGHRRSTPPY